MTKEDIASLDHPANYRKRESSMNAWLNVIYKMMADGCSNELIYFYIRYQKTKLDEYLEKYGKSEIQSFCNGIKKDITPVKNAISFSVSSGFVEGNSNKYYYKTSWY